MSHEESFVGRKVKRPEGRPFLALEYKTWAYLWSTQRGSKANHRHFRRSAKSQRKADATEAAVDVHAIPVGVVASLDEITPAEVAHRPGTETRQGDLAGVGVA